MSISIIGGASPSKFILSSSSLSYCVLSSIRIKLSSIKFCKFLLSAGFRFFKILSERAFMSTSSVLGGAVGGMLVGGLITSSAVTMLYSGGTIL